MEASKAGVEREPRPRPAADPSLLMQVLQNPVSNAIKFAGDKPFTIRTAARREAMEWRSFVKGHGIGHLNGNQACGPDPFIMDICEASDATQ